MNLKQCYALLEIQEDADKADIRRAYRDLVAIWHPDRYQDNPRLQEKATEKLKALNAAYGMLMAHPEIPPDSPARHPDVPRKKTPESNRRPTRQPPGPVKAKRSLAVWITLLAAVAVTALLLHSRWPFPLPGPAGRQQIDGDKSSIHALAAARLEPEQIVELQQALTLIGYDSGPADGNMGPRTLQAAQQFAADFQVARESDSSEFLLAEASRQASVARVHPEWRTIAASQDFQNWIDNQAVSSPVICREVLATGSAAQVINLVHSYFFHKEDPEPVEPPPTGIMEKRFFRGMAPLNVKTRHEGRHFLVKLLELPGQKEILSAFVRSGDTLNLRVPLGEYALKYAVGSTWYGTPWLFGSETVYNRIEEDIAFTFGGNELSGYRIELYIEPKLLTKKTGNYAFDF
jgi:hypothetical protein